MVTIAVMCFVKYYFLLFCLLFLNTYALNCRSDGGPKEAELKNIYAKCLKMQEGKNSTNQRGNFEEQDWNEPRYSRRNWERGRMGSKEENKDEENGRNDDRTRINDNRMGSRDDKMGNRDNRMSSNDRMDSNRARGRKDMTGNSNNKYGRNDNLSGREDFPQSNEFGSDMSKYNYHSSTQPPRRYKREKRIENSGHRSQYNPNSKKSEYEDSYHDYRNSSENNNSSKEEDNKACALHCFMENLEMTGDNGMPDRYLVTHAITKDVNNEDLKDFLQESIEECFQILDNENTEDKCEFSKDLLMCLSEKGRANCDDWKDDLRF